MDVVSSLRLVEEVAMRLQLARLGNVTCAAADVVGVWRWWRWCLYAQQAVVYGIGKRVSCWGTQAARLWLSDSLKGSVQRK